MTATTCQFAALLAALFTSVVSAGRDDGRMLIEGSDRSLNSSLWDPSIQPCSEEAEYNLVARSGVIYGQGGPPGDASLEYRICRWLISGDPEINAIDFLVDHASFAGLDRLLFFSDHTTLLAEFSAERPLPTAMSIVRSQQAVIVLVSSSEFTRFSLRYSSQTLEGEKIKVLSQRMSLSRLLLVIGVLTCCIVFVCIPACLCWFWRSGPRFDRVYDESAVMSHAQHAQGLARAVTEDNLVMGKLDELPSSSYQDATDKKVEGEECVLCFEAYGPEDVVRVLPCKHYFHKDCIDHWFTIRRFRLRTCPICRGNPLAERNNARSEQELAEIPVIEAAQNDADAWQAPAPPQLPSAVMDLEAQTSSEDSLDTIALDNPVREAAAEGTPPIGPDVLGRTGQ